MRSKSLASLTHALRMGDAIGADGVVLHPGSRVEGAATTRRSTRVGEVLRQALDESESCRLLLENTAGRRRHARAARSRSSHELIEPGGGDKRIGICLDCCHMLASGFDIRTADGLDAGDRRLRRRASAIDRLRCLHVNDSQAPLGSNRDRHAPPGDGELGDAGLRRVPVRAALRGPAGGAREVRRRRADGSRADRDREVAAQEGPCSAQAQGQARPLRRPDSPRHHLVRPHRRGAGRPARAGRAGRRPGAAQLPVADGPLRRGRVRARPGRARRAALRSALRLRERDLRRSP